MNKDRWFVIGAAIVIPLVMLLAFNALVVQPAIGESGAEGRGLGVTRINSPVELNGTLSVKDAATFAGTQATTGASTFNGAVTANSTMAVVGNMTLSGFTIYSRVSITPTGGVPFTPTAEMVTLTPDAAIGLELAACTTGTATTLYNSVNASVVITDTGNGVLAGNQTLGQYDALRLACFGAKWVQISAVSAN